MLDQIIITDSEIHEPVQPLLKQFDIMAKSKRALLSCIQESLRAIEQANRTFDTESRRIAIIEYNDNRTRALRAGISKKVIKEQCRQAHYQCLAGILSGIALATVTGDYYNRVNDLIEWYEDDRHRMIDAGYQRDAIDSRMTKIKLKLVKK